MFWLIKYSVIYLLLD